MLTELNGEYQAELKKAYDIENGISQAAPIDVVESILSPSAGLKLMKSPPSKRYKNVAKTTQISETNSANGDYFDSRSQSTKV